MIRSDFDTLQLALPEGDTARVSLHGGQVLSWRTGDGREHLYCAPSVDQALTAGPQGLALRGGVPVCFPQFAARGLLPKHGFARTSRWSVSGANDLSSANRYGDTAVTLVLCDNAETQAVWPCGFLLALTITLGSGQLRLDCAVQNTGTTPCTFTMALHTYLRCGDIGRTRLEGLGGCLYEDALDGNRPRRQSEDALQVLSEIDRVYPAAPSALCLTEDCASNDPPQRKVLRQYGFEDWVVWNPGRDKAAALGDMPCSDWRHMLCVESGQIARPVYLRQGESWRAGVSLRVLTPSEGQFPA